MPGEVIARWFAFSGRAAEMGTTHGEMSEVGRAEPTIERVSPGKAAWSPVSSMKSVGTVTLGAQRMKSAFELSPDQVESHASAVLSLPNPTRPWLVSLDAGRTPNRTDARSDRETSRRCVGPRRSGRP
jgi:hypothetical protein